MPPKNKYTDPKLREEVKEDIKQSDKGGEPGQWSARKAQMMAKEYKKRGGDYNTDKSEKDESQKHLDQWGDEKWQTKEGSGEAKQKDGSRKRYLPKKAWENMTEEEKKQTDDKKQAGSKKGNQYVGNTGKAKNARKQASKTDEGNGSGDNQSAAEESDKSDDQSDEEEKETKKDTGSASRKRGRKQTDEGDDGDSKKQKQNDATPKAKATSKGGKSNGNTVGSKHDKAEAPAQPASIDRLPKKGTKAHWKALPGWVDGEVVEIVKTEKKVDGKTVKGSKDDPKIVLKSRSSGKICVHKVTNVYFD